MKRALFITALLGVFLYAPSCQGSDPTMKVLREQMVTEQIQNRGVADRRVLEVMLKVPRHLFVPPEERSLAYGDFPVAIGFGQTISQPYIVAFMTEALHLQPPDKVLEIGTGSGYQAAVLAELVREVYTVEIVPELARRARETLHTLGYENVHVRNGDGYQGWPEEAPFDAVIVTAAPTGIPEELVKQLKVQGRMIIPVGDFSQELILITKNEDGVVRQNLLPVRFVPMVRKSPPSP